MKIGNKKSFFLWTLFWSVTAILLVMFFCTNESKIKNIFAPTEETVEIIVEDIKRDNSFIADQDTWFPSNIDKDGIREIVIETTPAISKLTGTEVYWDASEAQDRSIICFLDEDVLHISSNGAGRILLGYDASYMFSSFQNVEHISGLDILDPKETGRMEWMFADCSSLKEIVIPENWDTSLVEDMSYMFFNCSSATTLDVSSLDTRSTQKMDYLFGYCHNLGQISMEKWTVGNLGNVSSKSQMFIEIGTEADGTQVSIGEQEMKEWILGDIKVAAENTLWPEFGTVVEK